jgi:hypothetical protein
VSEIRVESRSEIFPTYRLPAPPVRVISAVVDPSGGPEEWWTRGDSNP